MRPRASLLFTPIVALAASHALAQEASDVVAETFIEPRALERPPPNYPASALYQGKEGWVMLSYVVAPNGDVTEAMIEDSSGVDAFERSALEAVRKWHYSPALRNNTPVEKSMTKTRIVFQVQGGQKGATPEFLASFRQISALIKAGNLPKASGLLEEIETRGRANLYEDAWFWWLEFTYLDAAKSEDRAQMIRALQLALGYEVDYLQPDQFVSAAQRLYVLEVRNADFSAARNAFARLRDSKTARRSKYYEPTVVALTNSYQQIEQAINSSAVITVPGEIGQHEYWVHDLLRRSFSMSGTKGHIEAVDIRCSRGTKRYDSFPEDGVWNVPPSWGDCGVYIKGEPGTTFVFEEHPLKAGATAPK